MKHTKIWLACWLLFSLSQPTQILAWNKPTHMVIGAMVYQEMKKSSPKALARMIALLQKHPQYQQWVDQMNQYHIPLADRDERLLMEAARWPDDTRGSQYDHPSWHYINFLYQPSLAMPQDSILPTGEHILQAYKTNLDLWKSTAPDSSRAVALCWIMHLVGDVHQPLHTTSFVNAEFPLGDRGGNMIYIKAKEDSKTINLHSLWDGLLLASNRPQEAANTAIQLRNEVSRQSLSNLSIKNVEQWAKESFSLAKKVAYLAGRIQASTDRENGTPLPASYTTTAKSIAEKQVALAAYRLADLLAAK